jgi:hypothetical protein
MRYTMLPVDGASSTVMYYLYFDCSYLLHQSLIHLGVGGVGVFPRSHKQKILGSNPVAATGVGCGVKQKKTDNYKFFNCKN